MYVEIRRGCTISLWPLRNFINVVRVFHDLSFKSAISPAIFATSFGNYYEYAVKINMAEASATLAALEKAWSEHVSGSAL